MHQRILERVLPVVPSHKSWGVYLSCWFPRVISIWVALPVNGILEGACLPMESVIDDAFYFIFCFSRDKVRWWPRVVGAVGLVFVIRGQERGVEDVMNGPGYGELELISDR